MDQCQRLRTKFEFLHTHSLFDAVKLLESDLFAETRIQARALSSLGSDQLIAVVENVVQNPWIYDHLSIFSVTRESIEAGRLPTYQLSQRFHICLSC